MIYPTVLGYDDNNVVTLYREKFTVKLRNIFESLSLPEDLKQLFFSLEWEKQDSFLLHPDISSLLCDMSDASQTQISKELEYFLHDIQHYTPNTWKNIPGTSIKLTDRDNNPVQDNVRSWGTRDEEEWLEVFWKAFNLLKIINLGSYHELNNIIDKIVPIWTSVDMHNSCSYRWCIGTLYLWYTIETEKPEINILEALIHESSHNKLHLIMQSEKLHINDFSLQYYSPYRPDVRHMQWVFLWVHAIVPTVYVLLQAIEQKIITESEWKEKIMLYHIKNKLGLNVIKKYLKPTMIWKKILEDIIQVIQKCDLLIQEMHLNKEVDMRDIHERAKKHLVWVKEVCPNLLY